MEKEIKKDLIIYVLVGIIIVLICVIGYFVVNKKLDNNTKECNTTTKNINDTEFKKIEYKMVISEPFALCVDSKNDSSTCSDYYNNEIKIKYPVLEEKSNTLKEINDKILEIVNKNIKDLEDYPNVVKDSNDAYCIAAKIISTGKIIDYEHFAIHEFYLKSNDDYLNILIMNSIKSNCASGGYYVNDVIIYDKKSDRLITKEEMDHKISIDKYNELKNKFDGGIDGIFLFYSENGKISAIVNIYDEIEIYELTDNQWVKLNSKEILK